MICPLLSIGRLGPRECLRERCEWWDGWVEFDSNGVERDGCCSIRYLAHLEGILYDYVDVELDDGD